MNKIALINGRTLELDDGTLILCEVHEDLPNNLIGKSCMVIGEMDSIRVTISVLECKLDKENATMFLNGNRWLDGLLLE